MHHFGRWPLVGALAVLALSLAALARFSTAQLSAPASSVTDQPPFERQVAILEPPFVVPAVVQDPVAAAPFAPPNMPEALPGTTGLKEPVLATIDDVVQEGINAGLFPGATVIVAHKGTIVKQQAYGYASLYATRNQKLEKPETATVDSIFDLASVTKLFTSVLTLKLVEAGKLDIDKPVAQYLPEFAANGKEHVTVKNLLTHTGGLPAGIGVLSKVLGKEEVLRRAFNAKLTYAPNSNRLYSDIDFMVLGELVARLNGQPLEDILAQQITRQLGMDDTMYRPTPDLLPRVAATEDLPPRGMIRGVVHDPVAWAMGGVSGHAGIFGTARDLAVFAQMMLQGGQYGGVRILQPETVAAMTQLQVPASFNNAVGLGWELNQGWYMGSFNSAVAFGHTGYAGTSLVVDPKTQTTVILLTNRVHPLAKTSVNETRRSVANKAAAALR